MKFELIENISQELLFLSCFNPTVMEFFEQLDANITTNVNIKQYFSFSELKLPFKCFSL